jgi:hypothetical protein
MMSDDAGRSWSASLERLEQLERSWKTEGGSQFGPVHGIKTCLSLGSRRETKLVLDCN